VQKSNSTNRRQFNQRFASLVAAPLSLSVSALAGCPGSSSVDSNKAIGDPISDASVGQGKVTQIPLRVWVIGPIDNADALQRHWQSYSEQPVEFQSLSPTPFFESQDCPADVLVFPSRLIGELVYRKWIVPLPNSLSTNAESGVSRKSIESDSEMESAMLQSFPQAMLSAAGYGGVQYGLPLGFSSIQVLSSRTVNAISSADPQMANTKLTWAELKQRLASPSDQPTGIEGALVDADALVDRFLAIAVGTTSVNPKYGVLLDLRSMKARLLADEFVFAAELLRALATQPEGLAALVGSHSTAWQWINETQQPAYALVSPTLLQWSNRQLDSAALVPITSISYNSGAGMVVSLASRCQQTMQSTRFLQWLIGPRALEVMRTGIPGIVQLPSRGPDLADRLIESSMRQIEEGLPVNEPRLPGTYAYRQALAQCLIEMLSGKLSLVAALAEASERWDKISLQINHLQSEYEKSLGLNL
jgi:hypothetical protein